MVYYYNPTELAPRTDSPSAYLPPYHYGTADWYERHGTSSVLSASSGFLPSSAMIGSV